MKTQDYVTIIIRLMALFLLAYSIQNIITMISFWMQSDIFSIESVLSISFPIIGFTLLWFFSTKLAHMVTADLPNQVNTTINHSALLRIIIITLGFSLLVHSVIHLTYWLFNSLVFKANPEFAGMVDTVHNLKTNLATELIQIFLAIILLTKNYWITQALMKINAPEAYKAKDISE